MVSHGFGAAAMNFYAMFGSCPVVACCHQALKSFLVGNLYFDYSHRITYLSMIFSYNDRRSRVLHSITMNELQKSAKITTLLIHESPSCGRVSQPGQLKSGAATVYTDEAVRST